MESSLSMVIPDRKKLPQSSIKTSAGASGREPFSPDSGVSARVQPTEPSLNLAGMAFLFSFRKTVITLVEQDPSSLEGKNVNGIVLST